MTDRQGVVIRSAEVDQAFDDLVCEVSATLEAGEAVDLDAIAVEHPDQVERLRKLLPTLEAMAELGHSDAGLLAASAETREPAEPKTGVLGDYRIVREVGRGGMGVVYEAEQVSLGRKVALKVLPFAAMMDKRQLQRFQNEARAAASLKHPNIVQVYAVGCERAVHFYAMEYVEGETLAEVTRHLQRLEGQEDEALADAGEAAADLADSLASGRFAPAKASSDPDAPTAAYGHEHTPGATVEPARTPQAAISTERSTKSPAYFRSIAEIGVQVAEALDHAHQNGVVHRDVKPSNVILDNSGKPWVTDFGLARIETDATLTVTGDLLGTVRYMSPEQALAKRIVVDHRTDIYSLGVTLYELLTLQPVFRGQDRQELLRQIAFDEPKSPRKLNRAIPEELEIIVLKAMAKNPAERYETAQDLADDLNRFLEDRPIRARRPTLVQLAAKWSRRHKPVVWSAAVSVFVLLVVGLVGLGIGNRLIAKEKARTEDALGQSRDAEREEAEQRGIAEARGREADRQRRRAEENYRTARRAVDRLFTRVAERLEGKPHMEQIRRELLEDALEFYQRFLKERSDSPELKLETALAHRRAGEIQGFLGDWEKSLANHQASAKILRELKRLAPDNVDYRVHLARSHYYVAGAFLSLGQYHEAHAQVETGIPVWEEIVESRPHVPEYLEDFVRLCNRGELIEFRKCYGSKKKREYHARSREMLRRLREDFPGYLVEVQLPRFGNTVPPEDIELQIESERKIREQVAILEKQVDAHPDVPDYQSELARALGGLCGVLMAMERFDEAEAVSVRGIAIHQDLVAKYPQVQRYQVTLAWARYGYGLYLYLMGREAEATEHFRTAIDTTSKVLEKQPSSTRHLNHLLGMLNECPAPQFRDPERAIRLATGLLQSGESDGRWGALALAQVHGRKFEEALVSCKKARTKNGDVDDEHRVTAIEAVAEWHVHDKEEARRKLVRATTGIEENPQLNVVRHSLEYRLLRREFEELMGIDPDTDDWTLWQTRAAVCAELKQWGRAIEHYSRAIKLNPDNAMLYVQRSGAHRGKGDHAKAIDDCTAALRIDPELCAALHNRAIAYQVSGRYEQAIADYSKAIELAPDNASLYAARSEANLVDCRFDEALADAKRYAELRPDDKVAALIRVQMLVMAGRADEYRQACEEILDRFGKSERPGESCHAARACVLAPKAVPDPMVPVELAERAVSRDPRGWTIYTLGMAQFRAGQIDEAIASFDTSLNTAPTWEAHFLNWLGLALVHHQRGKAGEAQQAFREAIDSMEQNSGPTPQDRLEGKLLRREVEQLLGKSEKAKDDTESGSDE